MTGAIGGVGSSVGSTVGKAGQSVGSTVAKAGQSVGSAAQKAKVPALIGTAAAAGVAGGLALRSRMSPRRKLVRMPTGRNKPLKSVVREAQHVGKEIGKSGFRVGVGDVSMEVQSGRNSQKRDSPLEVLIKGLTSRHTTRN